MAWLQCMHMPSLPATELLEGRFVHICTATRIRPIAVAHVYNTAPQAPCTQPPSPRQPNAIQCNSGSARRRHSVRLLAPLPATVCAAPLRRLDPFRLPGPWSAGLGASVARRTLWSPLPLSAATAAAAAARPLPRAASLRLHLSPLAPGRLPCIAARPAMLAAMRSLLPTL